MLNSTHINNTYVENVMETQYSLSIIESFMLVFFSELNDKTFILILILKMKSNSITVFFSAFIGMVFLSGLSITFGYLLDYFLYQNFIDLVAILILSFSGIKMIIQGFTSKSKTYEDELLSNIKGELKEEKHREKQIRNKRIIEAQMNQNIKEEDDLEDSSSDQDNNLKVPLLLKRNSCVQLKRRDNDLGSRIMIQNEEESVKFSNEDKITENQLNENIDRGMCYYFWAFLKSIIIAKFGDRTQFSLFALSSIFNSYGVSFGAIGALTLVILLGVVIGHGIAKNISEKIMNLICGCLFLFVSLQVVYLNNYLS